MASSSCRRCKEQPALYRQHYCIECVADLGVAEDDTVERTCEACGLVSTPEDFRYFDAADRFGSGRPKYRAACFQCAFDSVPESLSPYQRSLVEVERISGIKHTVWMRTPDSLWNRLHYERMCELADVPLQPGHLLTTTLYRFIIEEAESCDSSPGCGRVSKTSPKAASGPSSTPSSSRPSMGSAAA